MNVEVLEELIAQQEEALKEGDFITYKGLCIREAALLSEREKLLEDNNSKILVRAAKNEAILKALVIDQLLEDELKSLSQDDIF